MKFGLLSASCHRLQVSLCLSYWEGDLLVTWKGDLC
jgi:hypothetical protein